MISMSVCLSVRSHISKTIGPNFIAFSMYAKCMAVARCLSWRMCISGFVDDVFLLFFQIMDMQSVIHIPYNGIIKKQSI